MNKRAFTLLELLIVVIIIGILALLFLPRFRPSKESVLNQEARSALKLIQSAEKIYRMEVGNYTAAADENVINNWLKLSLSNATNRAWNYTVTLGTGTRPDFNATARRNGVEAGKYYDRTLWINSTLDDVNCTPADRFCK